jgi:hypothetical protein
VIPTGICHCDSRRCLDSQPYFVIANATGILIPAGLGCCDSCRSPDSNRYGGNYGGVLLQLTSSTTCHALLIKIRNTFVLTSCQLIPKQQQDLPSVMASLDAPPMQLEYIVLSRWPCSLLYSELNKRSNFPSARLLCSIPSSSPPPHCYPPYCPSSCYPPPCCPPHCCPLSRALRGALSGD